ncbi:hypothetical protein HDU84_000143 [Entophlyctis sp. JEL0112]|nr:hypothetical protein HDU84_000143 [Entophlyctis sp. JEL0112]
MTPEILAQILRRVPEPERGVFKAQLGIGLAEQVDELREEVRALADILAEYHSETELVGDWARAHSGYPPRVNFVRVKARNNGNNVFRRKSFGASPCNTAGAAANLLKSATDGGGIGVSDIPTSLMEDLRNAVIEERDSLLADVDALRRSLDDERGLRRVYVARYGFGVANVHAFCFIFASAEAAGPIKTPTIGELQSVKERLELLFTTRGPRAPDKIFEFSLPGSTNATFFEQREKSPPRCTPPSDHDDEDTIENLKHELCLLDMELYPQRMQSQPTTLRGGVDVKPKRSSNTNRQAQNPFPPEADALPMAPPVGIPLRSSSRGRSTRFTHGHSSGALPVRNRVLLSPLAASTISGKIPAPPSAKVVDRTILHKSVDVAGSGAVVGVGGNRLNRKLRLSAASSVDSGVDTSSLAL